MKSDGEMAVPPEATTVIAPLVAPLGTVAVIDDVDRTVKPAEVPAKRTSVTPENPAPEIVTDVPDAPESGAMSPTETTTTGVVVVVVDDVVVVVVGGTSGACTCARTLGDPFGSLTTSAAPSASN